KRGTLPSPFWARPSLSGMAPSPKRARRENEGMHRAQKRAHSALLREGTIPERDGSIPEGRSRSCRIAAQDFAEVSAPPNRRSERRGEASQGEHPLLLERASFRGGARAPEVPGLGERGAGSGVVLGSAAGVADERPGVALKPLSPFLLPLDAPGHGKG